MYFRCPCGTIQKMRFKSLRIHILLISWVCFLLGLLFPHCAVAQKTIISGKVYDAATNEPLPFVNIAFDDSKVGTTSNMDGEYHLETYYASDSLIASFVGYKKKAVKVKRDQTQVIDFALEEGSVSLGTVVVNAKDFENPAHAILRKIIRNKPINNREKLDSYSYEVYNKIEFDLNNFDEKFTEKKIFNKFDFIFDHIDSSMDKVALPVFITENLSEYYYNRSPQGRKEVIMATKVSGINNESISQFLGQMYQDVNIYNNNISIFKKNFISPIADYGLVYYKYYLTDSAYLDNKWCYQLEFIPKNKAELTFSGHFWVNDTSFAIKEIEATIPKQANINFVENLQVRHVYREVENEVWMLVKEELLVDFNLLEKEMGFYGKKTTTYRDFEINRTYDPDFFSGPENVIVKSPVNSRPPDFWREARHEEISGEEQQIYDMVDRLKETPAFMTYVDIINFIFTGYKQYGPVELGPVFTFLSFNDVEGLRLKFGGRTSNEFSTRLMLEGYAAYGFKDEKWKYMLGGNYFLSKNPRQQVGLYYSEDMELIGQVPNIFPRDHIVQSLTTRNPQNKLIFKKEARAYLSREWFTGFSTKVEFTRSELYAAGDWIFSRPAPTIPEVEIVNNIITSQVSVETRFAFRETFVSGEFERISLGSKYPVVTIKADFGIKGALDSQYEYQRLTANVFDNVVLGPFGNLKWEITGGYTWQNLPFPLLFVHPGNESFFINNDAFNTMNYFEFVSDKYVSAAAEYHLEGFFLNKIPLFKKLKWRELIGARAIYGRFEDGNRALMQLPEEIFTLEEKPFAEAYIGVENILRFFRVDGIWRLTYLDNPNTIKFGILLGFDIQF